MKETNHGPIIAADIQYRLSGGAANADPLLALGGVKSSAAMPSGIFDTIVGAESTAGDIEYRCIYVHNNHGSLSAQNAVIWLQANTASADTSVAIGIGTAAINGTEQTVANESTAPAGVTFSEPANLGAALALGTLPAGQHKAVWQRRTINAGAAASADAFTLRTQCDTAA